MSEQTPAQQAETPLSHRIRPNSEAAPWVIEEVRRMEAELAALRAAVSPQEQEIADPADMTQMICEQHPELSWPHDDCVGPGCPLSVRDRLLRLKAEAEVEDCKGYLRRLLLHLDPTVVMDAHPMVAFQQLDAEIAKLEDRVRADVSGKGKTCATCKHAVKDAANATVCTNGSGANPCYMRLIAVPSVFGCIFHQPVAPQEDSQ